MTTPNPDRLAGRAGVEPATNTSAVQSQCRREERLRVQRDPLSLTGHPHFQSERMLDLVCRAHQLLWVPLKLAARWHARWAFFKWSARRVCLRRCLAMLVVSNRFTFASASNVGPRPVIYGGIQLCSLWS